MNITRNDKFVISMDIPTRQQVHRFPTVFINRSLLIKMLFKLNITQNMIILNTFFLTCPTFPIPGM